MASIVKTLSNWRAGVSVTSGSLGTSETFVKFQYELLLSPEVRKKLRTGMTIKSKSLKTFYSDFWSYGIYSMVFSGVLEHSQLYRLL